MYPQFPLYIVSKGRHKYMMTSKHLTEMGVNHYIVVEPDQVNDYKNAVKKFNLLATIIEMDMSYKEKYELLDNFGLTKSTGSGPARNFAWDHSISEGYKWHWLMDDNINGFFRLNNNLKVKVTSPGYWRAQEDFCLRYKNVAMAGPEYFRFMPRKVKVDPFRVNTRIYSCNLIRNDIPFRWRGRHNEDTILSLDILSDGWCTILFHAFLQYKINTQEMPGGNTDEIYHVQGTVKPGQDYAENGTLEKTQLLANIYPEITKIVWRYKRVHHHVDYRAFKNNKLLLNDDFSVSVKDNEYGMKLKTIQK